MATQSSCSPSVTLPTLAGHDSILAVDIGGSNIRAGIVEFNAKKKRDLCDAGVHRMDAAPE